MNEDNKEKCEIDKLINFIVINDFKGIFAKSGNQLENLSKTTAELTKVIEKADKSSTKLSNSLNWMTGVAVIIAILTFGLEIYKLKNP